MNTKLVTRTATVLGTTAAAASISFALAGPASAMREPYPGDSQGSQPAPANARVADRSAADPGVLPDAAPVDSPSTPWAEIAMGAGAVVALSGIGYAGRVTLRRRQLRPA